MFNDKPTINKLIQGDCLEVMREMDSESIDLIYLDPPFFSNRNYEVIWGDKGEIRSFEDRWSGGIEHYIGWLKERVIEMHRILKKTGSIYLHCDWHADAYIRVFVLDKVFGENNYLNTISWGYDTGATPKGKKLLRKHDSIFWYAKESSVSLVYELKCKHFIPSDDLKRYKSDKDGRLWRDNPVGDYSEDNIKKMESEGKIFYTKNKKPRIKVFLEKENEKYFKFKKLSDFWNDIDSLNSNSSERIGYPTQKPELLLERIIKIASNEDDIVLDPFVGGGTTVAVADKLNRKWIGIDQSVQAIKVSEMRLKKNLFCSNFEVKLHKYDYDKVYSMDAYEFEQWIISKFKGQYNDNQRHDMGIDGKLGSRLIQVKKSEGIGRNVVDNFKSACERHDKRLYNESIQNQKPIGYIIAFSFGKGLVEEIARLRNHDGIIIELVKVEDIIPIAHKPKFQVILKDLGKDEKGLHEIEFSIKKDLSSNIVMCSWAWKYRNQNQVFDVIRDTDGNQKHKFEPGEHIIAVKAVDDNGLESIDEIKLVVNGEVVRKG